MFLSMRDHRHTLTGHIDLGQNLPWRAHLSFHLHHPCSIPHCDPLCPTRIRALLASPRCPHPVRCHHRRDLRTVMRVYLLFTPSSTFLSHLLSTNWSEPRSDIRLSFPTLI